MKAFNSNFFHVMLYVKYYNLPLYFYRLKAVYPKNNTISIYSRHTQTLTIKIHFVYVVGVNIENKKKLASMRRNCMCYLLALYFTRHICLFLTFIPHEIPSCRHWDTNQWVNIRWNWQISCVNSLFCCLISEPRLEICHPFKEHSQTKYTHAHTQKLFKVNKIPP